MPSESKLMTLQDAYDVIDQNNAITVKALRTMRMRYADSLVSLLQTCEKNGMDGKEMKRLGTYLEGHLISWPWQPEARK